jgi:hypothetical protein
MSNGPVAVIDTSPTPSQLHLQNINILDFNLKCGHVNHTGNNPYGAWVYYGKNVTLRGTVDITDTTGAATRFRVGCLDNTESSTISIKCDAVPAGGGIQIKNSSTTTQISKNNRVSRCTLSGGSANCNYVQIDASSAAFGTKSLVVEDNDFLDMPAASYALYAASGQSTVSMYRNNFTESAPGNARMVAGASGTSITSLRMYDNDASALATPLMGAANTGFSAFKIYNNPGYKTQSKGVATIPAGSTSVTVSPLVVAGKEMRFLDATVNSLPQVSISPAGTLGNASEYWAAIATDQTFTINIDQIADVDITFSWAVDTGTKPLL